MKKKRKEKRKRGRKKKKVRSEWKEIRWFELKFNLIGRWLFTGWRVTRMWCKVLDTGLRFRRNIHHIAFGLYFGQQTFLLRLGRISRATTAINDISTSDIWEIIIKFVGRCSIYLLTWCCCWGSCLISWVVCWCWGCCGKCWYRWLCARPGLASPSLSPTVTQLIIFLRCDLCDVLCAVACPLVCDWLLEWVCCIGWTTRGVDCVLKL